MKENRKRKHSPAVIFAAAILTVCGLSVPASAAASGDINSDGSINKADAETMVTWLTTGKGKVPLSAADMNGDGKLTAIDLSMLKQRILDVPETPTDPIYIHLSQSGITYEGGKIDVSGKTATISQSGEYYIDGSINGGQILVQVPDEMADSATVKLFLNGVSMTNSDAPCIMVENAEKTSVNLVAGKENTLSDGKEAPAEEVEPTFAVLHAKDDLTVKGDGALTIQAGIAYGIHCNNDLKLNGGSLNIATENGDAVRGRTSVTVKDGTIVIDTEGDGIKSTKGSLEVVGGTVQIKSGKDAVQAETDMSLTGGTIEAYGDHGLKAGGTITLDSCTLLATATENAVDNISSGSYIQTSFVKEWAKNNPIALTDGSKDIVFNFNTRKKYRYALIASPELKSGSSYQLYAGGIQVEQGGKNSFKVGEEYTNVNNTDHADLLYGRLYDKTKVHKIDVLMDKAQWNEFLSHADDEVYYPCDVIVDGERLNNVGIRTKGNSSRMFVSQGKSQKYSWRIKFDKYDKYQNYYGLTELCMNNMFSDPSCMRDMLCYDALHEIDGVGPNCSWTDMYLNGELFSFYFLAEQPGDTLAERLATKDDAVLYKATDKAGNNGGGNWFGGGGGNGGYCSFTDSMALDNFDVKWGKDDSYEHIAAIKTAINKLSSNDYKFIEDVIDVPSFLKGFAVNSVMCNYDSYNGTLAHNYYLMYNDGKAYFVGWDYNLSLGNFMDQGQSVTSDVTTSLYQVEVKDRPLAKLLQVKEYYDLYVSYVKEITKMYANPEQAVKGYADLISSHAKNDPHSFFQPDQFDKNISRSATGLQVNQGGGGGGWNMFGGMFGMGGGVFSFGGENVSIVDFLIKRNEIISQSIH